MSVDRIAYGTSTAIVCTLASLASSSTVGRGGVAVDNTTNLYVDAMLTVKVKTSASALSADLACYVYLFGSEDGTLYSGDGVTLGTDVSVTLATPSNLKGPYVISCPASATSYTLVIGSVASSFGGILPRKWGFVVLNTTGQALDATGGNHQTTYTGITYTDT